VIQLLPCEVEVRSASLAIDLANGSESSIICPRLVPQGSLEKHMNSE
jgi:hypothetical protein